MFGLGVTEIAIIFIIVLLFFGGRALPKLGSGLAQGIKNFQQGLKSKESDTESKDDDF